MEGLDGIVTPAAVLTVRTGEIVPAAVGVTDMRQFELIAAVEAMVQVTNLPAVVTATVPPVLPVASAKVRAGAAAKFTRIVISLSVAAALLRAMVKVVAVVNATDVLENAAVTA